MRPSLSMGIKPNLQLCIFGGWGKLKKSPAFNMKMPDQKLWKIKYLKLYQVQYFFEMG